MEVHTPSKHSDDLVEVFHSKLSFGISRTLFIELQVGLVEPSFIELQVGLVKPYL